MAKKKLITSWDLLEKIADDGRFTRDQTEIVSGDCESWQENADALYEKLGYLTDMDFELGDMDGLDMLGMGDVTSAIETLQESVEKAREIRTALEEFLSQCGEFVSISEEWRDAEEREERADARERLIEVASELRDKVNELKDLGVNVEVEGGIG